MEEIVSFGVGSGQRRLLAGLASHPCRVTAIAGVTGNTGTGGRIRTVTGLPHPGGPAQALLGLATPGVLRKLFDYRFRDDELEGMSLGEHMIAALARIEGDFGLAIERASQILETPGPVLPVTTRSTNVCAELVTGWKIVGEREIVTRTPRARIMKLYLEDEAPLYPPCADAIARADLIVMGPGALLTGLVPLILTHGLRNALRDSPARLAFVCNLVTQPGQTDGYTARDHVRDLEIYLGFNVDHIVLNQTPIPSELRTHFAEIGAEPVEDDFGDNIRAVRGEFLQEASLETLALLEESDPFFLFHDSARLAKAVTGLL